MDSHPLDQIDSDAKKSQEDFARQCLLDSSLVFSVFGTESGAKLLERWKDVLIWSPTATPNDNQLTIGMNEGYKAFIRSILQAVKIHEEQQ